MADNTILSSAIGSGDTIVDREISHAGDTAKLQGVFAMGISGTEGSYTAAAINGDATNGLDVDVTRVGGTVAVSNAGTFAVQVDNTVTVASHAVTNAGTFAVQAAATLAAETTKVIGTVNVAAAQTIAVTNAGTFAVQATIAAGATTIGKAEDAVHSSGDVGVMALAVRQDSHADLAADGDYIPLTVDADGGLRVTIVAGAGSGGTAAADDADFTDGTTSFTPIGGVYESTPSTVTDGDMGMAGITVNRELKVNVSSGGIAGRAEDAAAAGGEDGIPVLAVRRDAASSGVGADGDWANLSVTSDGSLRVTGGGVQFAEDAAHVSADVGTVALAVRRDTAAVGSGTDGDYSTLNVNATGRLYTSTTVDAALPAGTNNIGDVDVLTLPALVAGTANIGDVDVLTVPADPFGVNADAASATGSISAKLRFIAATGIPITGTVTVGSHAVTNAGTFAVQNTAQASTATQEMVGDAADDAAAAGNPVLLGGVAVETDGTDPTQVSAEGDVAQLRTDRQRILLVNQTHPRSFFTSVDYASAQTNASIQAAPGANLSLYITDIIISNGAVAGNITLLDGSGGTVKFECYPAINGGVSATGLRSPIRLTANTALCITSTTVTTHSVNVGGYIAP